MEVNLNQRLDELESELKIIKNEVQSVLLDVREHVLSYYKNPFQMVNVQMPKGGGGGDSAMLTANFSGDSRGDRGQTGEREVSAKPEEEHAGGDEMEESQERSRLKALMDQLEKERQALKEQEDQASMPSPPSAPEAAAQPGAAGRPGSVPAPQYAPPAQMQVPPEFQPMQQPMQMPQAAPWFQPPNQMGQVPPGFQPMQQPMQQSMQMPQAAPGFQPNQVEDSPHDRDAKTSDGLSYGPGVQPRKRTAEKGSAEEDGRRRVSERISGLRGREPQGEWNEPEEESPSTGVSQVNLLTLVGLVRWVERSIKKIGKDKVEAIVEIYRTAGYLPESYKEVIAQIIRLAEGEKPEGPVTMGVSILVLLQLDSLMGGKFQTESSILSTLFTEDGGYPWTKQ